MMSLSGGRAQQSKGGASAALSSSYGEEPVLLGAEPSICLVK